MHRKFALAAALLLAGATSSANAAIVIGQVTAGTAFRAGGTFLKIAPPAAVGVDNFNDNNVRGFDEVQNLTLLNALTLDSPAAPTLAAGTVISSHLIVFDPAGAQTDPTQPTVGGYVEFDAPILGIAWTDARLAATNGLLGASGTGYLAQPGVGLEQGVDFFAIAAGNANRLNFTILTATSPGDVLRVVTGRAAVQPGAVPEPATWLSMIFGFGLIGAALRSRKASRAIAA
jgi:hypothetical protein